MLSTNDIIEQLTREIAERARVEPADVKPDAHFIQDLGMSSLDLLNVLAYAEKSFCARFPDERIGELTSLDRVVEAVRVHQSAEVVNKA
jgi:acyl carrier protein